MSLFKEYPTLYEYLILLSLPAELIEDVNSMKQDLSTIIPPTKGNKLNSTAHITLLEKLDPKLPEKKLLEAIETVLTNFSGFTTLVNHTEVLMHGKSLFTLTLKIEQNELIEQIYTSLRPVFGIKTKSIKAHITLVKSISKEELNRIPFDVSRNNYSKEFHCEGITILKRWVKGPNQYGPYEFIAEVKF